MNNQIKHQSEMLAFWSLYSKLLDASDALERVSQSHSATKSAIDLHVMVSGIKCAQVKKNRERVLSA
jgi:hypothetical protein